VGRPEAPNCTSAGVEATRFDGKARLAGTPQGEDAFAWQGLDRLETSLTLHASSLNGRICKVTRSILALRTNRMCSNQRSSRMYIVHIDIRNFRGIKRLAWLPAAGVNCLVGSGDTTKTTILDAIELALNPRWYPFADDSDFFDLDVEQTIKITVTLAGLPADFKADDQYGLHLRGWDAQQGTLKDEPGEGLEDALSLRLVQPSGIDGLILPLRRLRREAFQCRSNGKALPWFG
jgi:hypothetical protein